MFNLWNRSYVHIFRERYVFNTKTIIADPEYANVVFTDGNFFDGGALLHCDSKLQPILDEHYDGKLNNLFAKMLTSKDDKWSLSVKHEDYHYILACFMKELQHTFKFSDADLNLLTFSHLYDTFYFAIDAKFLNGFASGEYQAMVRQHLENYTPTGVLDSLTPEDLSTELAFFLVKRGLITEEQISKKIESLAILAITEMANAHQEDFSEWLILDTKRFLNAFRDPEFTPAVETDQFTLDEMIAYIKSDDALNTLFFRPFIFEEDASQWGKTPTFKKHASRLLSLYERLSDYVLESMNDPNWINARTAGVSEYEAIKRTCSTVRYILQLDGAPASVDKPLVDMLGFETLVESLNSKYNKTMLLMAMHGASNTFVKFANSAFGD